MDLEYGKEYSFEEAKEALRKVQIDILDTVAAICEKHGLKYWLDGGTLLGAVRHQGFIPWDDDIDIGLMREDYEILVRVLPQELPSHMVMQTRRTDKYYKLAYMKVRDKNSIIEDRYTYNGIFIDIFPFDMVPKTRFLQSIQRGMTMLMEATVVHTEMERLHIAHKKGFKASIVRLVMRSCAWVGRFLNETRVEQLYKLIRDISNLNKSSLYGEGIAISWAYYRSIRDIRAYQVVKEGLFHGNKYYIPKNYDYFLRTFYGDDYMIPIPSENVHIKQIIFLENRERNSNAATKN